MNLRRETPLKKCPRTACQRAQTCLDRLPEFYCRKIFMTPDDRRMQLAAKLNAMMPNRPRPMDFDEKDETWKAILLAGLQAAHARHRGNGASQRKYIKRAERIGREWQKKKASQLAANSQTP